MNRITMKLDDDEEDNWKQQEEVVLNSLSIAYKFLLWGCCCPKTKHIMQWCFSAVHRASLPRTKAHSA